AQVNGRCDGAVGRNRSHRRCRWCIAEMPTAQCGADGAIKRLRPTHPSLRTQVLAAAFLPVSFFEKLWLCPPGRPDSRQRRDMQRFLECAQPRGFLLGLVVLVSIAGAMNAPPAMAQGVADFYRGKQITFMVGSSPGGGYDAIARLVARH